MAEDREQTARRPRLGTSLRELPILVKVVLALVIAFVILWGGTSLFLRFRPYYAVAPGDAVSVSRLITVPPAKSHPVRGTVLLTDVLLGPVNAAQLLADLFDPNVDLEPQSEVLGPNGTAQQLTAISNFEMQQSQDYAKIAALSHLGIAVSGSGHGALVLSVIPGVHVPLQADDVITSVDGQAVTGPSQLESAVEAHRPGDRVTLTIDRGIGGAPHTLGVTLISRESGGRQRPLIGVEIFPEPVETFALPFPISINSDQIGGPSAGLAFTLGLIDQLSNGNITGGRIVAATGEIDAAGNVQPIGGLPQKTVAVRAAGASLFLVPFGEPKGDYQRANAVAEGHLAIVRVRSVTDALRVLAQRGGDMRGISLQPVAAPPSQPF